MPPKPTYTFTHSCNLPSENPRYGPAIDSRAIANQIAALLSFMPLLAQARPTVQRILLVCLLGRASASPTLTFWTEVVSVCMCVFVRRTVNTFVFVE